MDEKAKRLWVSMRRKYDYIEAQLQIIINEFSNITI